MLSNHQALTAEKLYRWVDENGKTRYADKLPPDQVQYRRETLNKSARVIDVTEKEKTKAQQELEKRLTVLRKQQESILEKQKMKDKVLLSTYRNLNDMTLVLEGKMLALDSQRRVVQGNLDRLKKQLRQQQQKAAQHEKDGKKVPDSIKEEIRSTREQIDLTLIEISNQFENKKKVRQKLESDIKRFKFLTQSPADSNQLTLQTADNQAETELGVYICENLEICNKAWEYAKQFVYTHSTTGIYIESDNLIMSQEPKKENDLSLSVSNKKVTDNRQQLFLDIQCHISSLGKELCDSSKTKRIRHSFSDFIHTALNVDH